MNLRFAITCLCAFLFSPIALSNPPVTVTTPSGSGSGALVSGKIPVADGPADINDSGLAPPSSAFVGTTDIQTLTNKTFGGTATAFVGGSGILSLSSSSNEEYIGDNGMSLAPTMQLISNYDFYAQRWASAKTQQDAHIAEYQDNVSFYDNLGADSDWVASTSFTGPVYVDDGGYLYKYGGSMATSGTMGPSTATGCHPGTVGVTTCNDNGGSGGITWTYYGIDDQANKVAFYDETVADNGGGPVWGAALGLKVKSGYFSNRPTFSSGGARIAEFDATNQDEVCGIGSSNPYPSCNLFGVVIGGDSSYSGSVAFDVGHGHASVQNWNDDIFTSPNTASANGIYESSAAAIGETIYGDTGAISTTISGGSYVSSTGVVTLTMASGAVTAGQAFSINSIAGSGASQLDGTWLAGSATSGTTLVFQAPAGLGAISITGGNIAESQNFGLNVAGYRTTAGIQDISYEPSAINLKGTYSTDTILLNEASTPTGVNLMGTYSSQSIGCNETSSPACLHATGTYSTDTILLNEASTPTGVNLMGTYSSQSIGCNETSSPTCLHATGTYSMDTILLNEHSTPTGVNLTGTYSSQSIGCNETSSPACLRATGTYSTDTILLNEASTPTGMNLMGTYSSQSIGCNETSSPACLHATGTYSMDTILLNEHSTPNGIRFTGTYTLNTILLNEASTTNGIKFAGTYSNNQILGIGWNVDQYGNGTFLSYKLVNLADSSTAPTISSGFGSSPSISHNNGTAAFTIKVGTGGSASNGAIGFPAAANGWAIHCDDITTQSSSVFVTKQVATSTTSATITNYNTSATATAWASGDTLVCQARAY